MQKITLERTKELIDSAVGKKIIVIGDVMLDRYFWGSVSRISPEAPVPVVDIENETFHLGGAANVASNLKSLGADVILCGLIGNDNSGKLFIDLTSEIGINPGGLYIDKERPTTVKTRIIGNNQQITRLDREKRDPITSDGADFIRNLIESIDNLSGVIFEDYNKGTITKEIINSINEICIRKNIMTFVDPKFDNFFEYKKPTVFKPNRKEAEQAINLSLKTKDNIITAGKTLIEKLEAENILLTLGSDGMMLFESNGDISSVPTKARQVADVSGAGDTAIATLSLFMTAGATIKEAATLANFASGYVCEIPGIVSITPNELLKSVKISLETENGN
jgi:rfaE bifunctional protein kinase chain/domain